MSKVKTKGQKLPIIIVLTPHDGVLPEGFPLRADNFYNEQEVLVKLAKLLEVRDDKQSAGSEDPMIELWAMNVNALRFLRQTAKWIERIMFKVILDVPEGDYSPTWSTMTSDLPSYAIDQFVPHMDPEDPLKQQESKLTEENQEKTLEADFANLDALLEKADSKANAAEKDQGSDGLVLGTKGEDDTYGANEA